MANLGSGRFLVIGDPVETLETPVLVVELDSLEHNLAVIADHYHGMSIRVRPHGKNHKSPRILQMQIAAGATVSGVCAAKVSEAEVFAEVGVDNLLIANQVVDAHKIARLGRLAERADTMVAVDALEQVDLLATRTNNATLGVVVEIDTMMGRGGVRTVESAVALARRIVWTPGLEFRGVMSHQVPTRRPPTRRQRFAEGGRYIGRVLEVKRAIEAAGIPVGLVSTGESWTYDVAATHPEVTEIEAGTYALMEVPYAYMSEFRFAAKMMGRVVEKPDRRTAVGDVPIDAIGAPNGLPTVDGVPGVVVTGLDHHGVTLTSEGDMPLALGDSFFLLTHQQDITVNRWDRLVGIRNGVVETVFEALARGCVH